MAYPVSPYIEERNGGLYIVGTRVGLDAAYPSTGSLAKVYGAITHILEHPQEIEAYLAEQNRRYEEIQARYPLTPDMIQQFERRRAGCELFAPEHGR